MKVYVGTPTVQYRFTIASTVLFNIYSMSHEISGNEISISLQHRVRYGIIYIIIIVETVYIGISRRYRDVSNSRIQTQFT